MTMMQRQESGLCKRRRSWAAQSTPWTRYVFAAYMGETLFDPFTIYMAVGQHFCNTTREARGTTHRHGQSSGYTAWSRREI